MITENEKEYLDKFLELFDKEDKFLAYEFLEHVMQHFSWTKIQTIKEFLKDSQKLHDKFIKWKQKHKLETIQ